MKNALEYFDNTISRDFFHLITGQLLGSGVHRQVFSCSIAPQYVIKFETGSQSFANVREWELWNWVADQPDIAKHLAPCRFISPCGSILIQDRTTPARDDEFPEKILSWFTDTKKQNFGILNSCFVCHDYANNLALNSGTTKRTKKAEWW